MPTRKRLLPVLAATLVLGSLHGAASASAAAEFGNTCTANNAGPGVTIFQTGQTPGSSIPLAAPITGVVVKWKISLVPGEFALPHVLKILRPAGPKQFQVVGESAPGTVVPGANTFEASLAVQAGDLLGLYGISTSPGTLACSGPVAVGAKAATLAGNPPVGSTATTVEEAEEIAGAVSAVVEPDADKDGFGDETQDKCPQSAAVQAVACPVLLLDAVSQAPGKGSVRILVASSSDSSITVSASAKLPAKAKKAGASAQAKLASISQLVTPGKIAVYALNYNKALKDALKALPRKKSLNLEVTAVGKSLAGADSSDKLTVKLKGQAKP